MNKKKLLTLVLSLVLIGAVGVGATLAYFTDTDTAFNTVKMGKVEIELEEPNFNADNALKLVPGAVVDKDPTITVVSGSNPAYIRVKITDANNQPLSDELLGTLYTYVVDDPETEVDETKKVLFEESENWTLGTDGYYYYSAIVNPENSVVVFNKVCIPVDWNNDYALDVYNINITAEAIQAEGLADDFFNADGFSWNIAEEKIIRYEVAE